MHVNLSRTIFSRGLFKRLKSRWLAGNWWSTAFRHLKKHFTMLSPMFPKRVLFLPLVFSEKSLHLKELQGQQRAWRRHLPLTTVAQLQLRQALHARKLCACRRHSCSASNKALQATTLRCLAAPHRSTHMSEQSCALCLPTGTEPDALLRERGKSLHKAHEQAQSEKEPQSTRMFCSCCRDDNPYDPATNIRKSGQWLSFCPPPPPSPQLRHACIKF